VEIARAAGETEILHTTAEHPFWDQTLARWVGAGDLVPGHRLSTTEAGTVTVVDRRPAPGSSFMLNLTVSDLHTYYVLAGKAAILVHNEGDGPTYYRGVKPGEDLSFEARPKVDFKVDSTTGYVIPGRGPSLTTDPAGLARYGRTGVPVDMGSIPDGLEVVREGTKPGHYELAVKSGVNMTASEFQAKLSGVRGSGCP
jgi:hypothetical protein